jgi:2-C-methyl-D-erythritol 4-phosphate cytidylyltransferase
VQSSALARASAIIVAAGRGTRLGGELPKAFVELGGLPMVEYSVRRFAAHQSIGEIVLVVQPGQAAEAREILDKNSAAGAIVNGGEHRWLSVRNGLLACTHPAPWVLVHDAARPFVTEQVITALLDKTSSFDCAVTATPEVDTVRLVDGDRSVETLDRSKLVRIGTPQLFRKDKLAEALALAESMEVPPTDEAILMERMGIAVGIAQGDPLNFKVTTPADLTLARALVAAQPYAGRSD